MEQRGKENRLITRRAARRRQRTRAGSAARPSPWRPGSARQGRRSAPRGGSCMEPGRRLHGSAAPGPSWVIGHDNARARRRAVSMTAPGAARSRQRATAGMDGPDDQPRPARPPGSAQQRRGAQLHGADGRHHDHAKGDGGSCMAARISSTRAGSVTPGRWTINRKHVEQGAG